MYSVDLPIAACAVATVALILAGIALALIAPVYGKLFFSTHTVELRPAAEIAALRKLGAQEDPEPVEEANKAGQTLTSKLFGDERYRPMSQFRPKLKRPYEGIPREEKEQRPDRGESI